MWRSEEFPMGAAEWPPGLDRREFLRLMGASLALGGVVGCSRPAGRIVPYVTPPEEALPGAARFYATAIPVEGFARGILVESHLGRPTKIEGNPDHPESLGATDAITQAAILSLYDPDRSKAPLLKGSDQPWEAYESEIRQRRPGLIANRGKGMVLLTEPTTSPTFLREVGLFLEAFPEARWHQYSPLATHAVDGLQVDCHFRRARVVLLIGSDCLIRHPACIRYSREFAATRRVEQGRPPTSRVYAIEATPTLTGAMADFRLPASPDRTRELLDLLSRAMDGVLVPEDGRLTTAEREFIAAVSRDLREHGPDSLCVAGTEQDPDVQAWALAMNARIGAIGRTVDLIPPVRSDADSRCAGRLDGVIEALRRDEVRALFILGANPAYTSAEFRELSENLNRVPFSVHLGSHADETGSLCRWHLPEAHFLEAWNDLRGYEGTASILQPLIEPLHGGRSAIEILHGLHDPAPMDSYGLVRQTWSAGDGGPESEGRWARWLRNGWVDGEPGAPKRVASEKPMPSAHVSVLSRTGAGAGLTLILVPDSNVLDGRWANNAWLQELPRPLTQLVWDNAALISPTLAATLGAENGDVLRLERGPSGERGSSHVDAAAWVMPGQAPDCVTLSLGYGRTHAGSVGSNRGFDAYPIRRADAPWEIANVHVRKTGARYDLVTTQHHFTMEGRDPVRVLRSDRIVAGGPDPRTTLFPEWTPGTYSWGMSIDLGTCLGCNACVLACQAENNTPVVGKDQVSRGREMHWIRIDRYFDGDLQAPVILNQPVPCMHCEKAPCELVCPVGATVHSSEGLNEMVYNRCVGTRYCSNNCPYKVRRFNFLDYRAKPDSPENLQKNPDVTVRERGVMEKCTYCVQRINAARIDAGKANRPILDGEIRTACQQACPVEAIVFGNVGDPDSRVSARKRELINYSLLGELNTRPRTTYLAKVTHAGANHPA